MVDNLTGTDKKMLAYLQNDIGEKIWKKPMVRPLKISLDRFNGNERVRIALTRWLSRNYGLHIVANFAGGYLNCY